MFNIITRKTLLEFCKKYPKAANALQEWYHELIEADFKNFQEVKYMYGNASLVGNDRVVFNIMGNTCRLVVRMVFTFRAIQIKCQIRLGFCNQLHLPYETNWTNTGK